MKASHLLLAILVLHFFIFANSSYVRRPRIPKGRNTTIEFIKKSCNVTIYPYLCIRSLSRYASKIHTSPKLLVHAALNVTLNSTTSTSRLVRKLSKKHHGFKPIEAAAIADCVEVVGDSVDLLQQSMGEMEHLPGGVRADSAGAIISDIETWVSAAITDDDTCLDGIEEANSKNWDLMYTVRRHIWRITHLTSNALALFNTYAEGQSKSP